MPGPYAHITLLYELMRPSRLESIFTPLSGFGAALETHFPYCMLGAVSPDYPNLLRGDVTAPLWADAMHYTRACEMITSGIRHVRDTEVVARPKQLAWLLGYCAHVATDVTIHPIVQAKVGVYAENQRQHRICEMNQDSYIYRRMNLGEIGASDRFARTIVQCCSPADATRLDYDIVSLWEGMLADVHPELFAEQSPQPAAWHREFAAIVAGFGDNAARLFPLASIIAAKMELSYPAYEVIDHQFVAGQLVPAEKPVYLDYDDIFDLAVSNVAAVWMLVERLVCAEDPADLPALGDWNLDNGRDEHGKLVFW